jgi:hypothetical protein
MKVRSRIKGNALGNRMGPLSTIYTVSRAMRKGASVIHINDRCLALKEQGTRKFRCSDGPSREFGLFNLPPPRCWHGLAILEQPWDIYLCGIVGGPAGHPVRIVYPSWHAICLSGHSIYRMLRRCDGFWRPDSTVLLF